MKTHRVPLVISFWNGSFSATFLRHLWKDNLFGVFDALSLFRFLRTKFRRRTRSLLIHTHSKNAVCQSNCNDGTDISNNRTVLSQQLGQRGKMYLKRERGPLAPVWAAWFINMRGYTRTSLHYYTCGLREPSLFSFSFLLFVLFLSLLVPSSPFCFFQSRDSHGLQHIYLRMLVV